MVITLGLYGRPRSGLHREMGQSDERFRLVAYGQNAEDVVLTRAFADRRAGFFVDVGAGEPVRGSLTKNLVDRLGRRGVSVEPLPGRRGPSGFVPPRRPVRASASRSSSRTGVPAVEGPSAS
ncbi:hypothetical protein [Streptosporangium sp. CA-115845]|uniref:hypothetical protein n=1 Tax=Streptosporangium sp. CA-115845 TaxID=3240071 RepID=UPI003D9400E9